MRRANFSLRQALAQYERAIELDPSADKAHYQLIVARASLLEPELAIYLYKKRLAAAPTETASAASWPALTSPGTTTATRAR